VVTETNGGSDWPDDGRWVREAFGYLKERGIVGACLFRYNYDGYRFGDRGEVLRAIKESE
jgi:hypothetical protein